MPTYEYRCTRCAHQFESVHGVGETVDRCERCGGPVRRIFSVPALIFKGSGFHINDYRKTPAPSEGDGKASGDGKAAGDGKAVGDGKAAGDGKAKSAAKKTTETKTSDSGSTDTTPSSASEGKKAS